MSQAQQHQPHYKLTYFNLKAVGESIRLIFIAQGIPYEDDRIEMELWPQLKSKIGHGQMPVLSIDGKQLTQSLAIGRFLGKRFGLIPENEFDVARLDELVEFLTELRLEFREYFIEMDASRKTKLKEQLVETTFPKYYNIFENLIGESPGPYLVGTKVSWADFFFANWLQLWEEHLGLEYLKDYPNLDLLMRSVFSIPEIEAYVVTRAKTMI